MITASAPSALRRCQVRSGMFMPALLTTMSSRPCSARMASATFCTAAALVTSAGCTDALPPALPILSATACSGLLAPAGQHHRCAVACQGQRGAFADACARARDPGDFAFEICHCVSSRLDSAHSYSPARHPDSPARNCSHATIVSSAAGPSRELQRAGNGLSNPDLAGCQELIRRHRQVRERGPAANPARNVEPRRMAGAEPGFAGDHPPQPLRWISACSPGACTRPPRRASCRAPAFVRLVS